MTQNPGKNARNAVGGHQRCRDTNENVNEHQVVHDADGASGSTAVMAVESVDRMCSLQAADVEEGRQNESALAPEHASAETPKALAEKKSSTLRCRSVISRNPPSVGIEKDKPEPQEQASGAREGRKSLESNAQLTPAHASADTRKALAETKSSALRWTSVISRNPPSVGIEKGKREARQAPAGAREGRESEAESKCLIRPTDSRGALCPRPVCKMQGQAWC